MTGSEILTKWNLQIDDASELSDVEALSLANDIYDELANDRPWEWLRATATGNTSTSVPYIALPSDFKTIMSNYQDVPVVFVGSGFSPYKVVPYADRYNYRNTDGYCYIDKVNSRLVFTLQPTTVKAIEYDYCKVHTALLQETSPLFRGGFHKIIVFGMAAAFNPIEQTEKTNSYQRENQTKFDDILTDMAMEEANFKVAYT